MLLVVGMVKSGVLTSVNIVYWYMQNGLVICNCINNVNNNILDDQQCSILL